MQEAHPGRVAKNAVPRRPSPTHGRRSSRSIPGGACGGLSLCLLTLLISWNPPTVNCKGGPIWSGIHHYEVKIFEMRQVGSSSVNPIYLRSASLSTTATSIEVDPPVGGVVGWDNMWSATWTLQPPPIVAVSRAGNRSDQPCP